MSKILEKLAIKTEPVDGSTNTWGYGATVALGAGNQIPFVSVEKGVTVNNVEDNSILSDGFMDTPVQIGKMVEKSFATNMYYDHINSLLYWAFGFENTINKVCCFTLSTPSTEPTGGAHYHDVNSNGFTFLRKEVQKSSTYYIFKCDNSVVPTLATGNLTKQSGTGDATLTFSARSSLMYEHLFELDSHERHLADFRTAEQITGYSSGYKKNRMITIGLKTNVTDIVYQNAMCKKFGFKSAAGQLVGADFDYCAYNELRGNYSSSTWAPTAEFLTLPILLAHHHLRFKIGTTESTLVNLGVSDVNFGLDIPLDNIQDTESGLYLSEPRLEGKYKLSFDAKLSRYAVTTYQGYRDSWTDLVAVLEAFSGYYAMELLFQNVKIVSAGPDSENVSHEPLKLEIGYTTTNSYPLRLYGNSTTIQNSPVLLRVRNLTSSNTMFTTA